MSLLQARAPECPCGRDLVLPRAPAGIRRDGPCSGKPLGGRRSWTCSVAKAVYAKTSQKRKPGCLDRPEEDGQSLCALAEIKETCAFTYHVQCFRLHGGVPWEAAVPFFLCCCTTGSLWRPQCRLLLRVLVVYCGAPGEAPIPFFMMTIGETAMAEFVLHPSCEV